MGSRNEIDIVYIAGAGRSGSTLLARLLGELDGVVNIGEATNYMLRDRMRARNIPCGCGSSVPDCSFWQGIPELVAPEVRAYAFAHLKNRNMWRLGRSRKRSVVQQGEAGVIEALRDVFSEVAVRTGCRVIVDASKITAHGYLLGQIPGVRLKVIHLFRDPRGVVSSWMRPKEYLRSFSPWKTLTWWVAHNIFVGMLRQWTSHFVVVEYDRFARSPRRIFEEIVRQLELPDSTTPFLSENLAAIGVQHPLAGNPGKFGVDEIVIKEHEWSLPVVPRIVVGAVGWPVVARYRSVAIDA